MNGKAEGETAGWRKRALCSSVSASERIDHVSHNSCLDVCSETVIALPRHYHCTADSHQRTE